MEVPPVTTQNTMKRKAEFETLMAILRHLNVLTPDLEKELMDHWTADRYDEAQAVVNQFLRELIGQQNQTKEFLDRTDEYQDFLQDHPTIDVKRHLTSTPIPEGSGTPVVAKRIITIFLDKLQHFSGVSSDEFNA